MVTTKRDQRPCCRGNARMRPLLWAIGAGPGALRSVSFPRWGNPDDHPYREHSFGVDVHREQTLAGTTLPAELSAGWWHGTDRWADGEFFRCTIDEAEFF